MYKNRSKQRNAKTIKEYESGMIRVKRKAIKSGTNFQKKILNLT